VRRKARALTAFLAGLVATLYPKPACEESAWFCSHATQQAPCSHCHAPAALKCVATHAVRQIAAGDMANPAQCLARWPEIAYDLYVACLCPCHEPGVDDVAAVLTCAGAARAGTARPAAARSAHPRPSAFRMLSCARRGCELRPAGRPACLQASRRPAWRPAERMPQPALLS